MTDIRILSNDSIAALRRDHERLRYEFLQARTQLRAFMSAGQDSGLKPLCRFVLTAALATSDETKTATITHQLGAGAAHITTDITVHNLGSHAGGSYVFAGDSGDAGYAFWNPHNKGWYIIQMECP